MKKMCRYYYSLSYQFLCRGYFYGSTFKEKTNIFDFRIRALVINERAYNILVEMLPYTSNLNTNPVC